MVYSIIQFIYKLKGFESEFRFLAQCKDGKFVIVRITLHELSDNETSHESESIR